MLIGKKIFLKILEKGKFYCPECRCTTDYFMKLQKAYYAVLGFPVWPLGFTGQYVECQLCSNSFRESVLESDPETSRAEFHPSMKRIMILMMLADGEIDDSEIEKIKEIYNRISGFQITKEEIRNDIELSMKEGRRVSEYLRKVTPYLNRHGKEQVLKAAYYIATADGVFQAEERVLLDEISTALDVEPDHYQAFLSSLLKTEEGLAYTEGRTNAC